MTDEQLARCYRFGAFEADASTGELRRKGVRIKLNAQPFQVLLLFLDRPGQVLTREEISRELWPDGTFVDFEHGVNTAVNRVREALGDTARHPRYIETLTRRGYRFVAPVERIVPSNDVSEDISESRLPVSDEQTTDSSEPKSQFFNQILATPEDLPHTSHKVVLTLFILLQLMYLAFYVGALANLAEIEDLVSVLPRANLIFAVLVVTAVVLIPVRAFNICTALFRPPRAGEKLLKLWKFLWPLDELWALSPFLLLHHINAGVALACLTLLVYSPFAQRSLILMCAVSRSSEASATAK
jgi:cholera toxin transcriptional activator